APSPTVRRGDSWSSLWQCSPSRAPHIRRAITHPGCTDPCVGKANRSLEPLSHYSRTDEWLLRYTLLRWALSCSIFPPATRTLFGEQRTITYHAPPRPLLYRR